MYTYIYVYILYISMHRLFYLELKNTEKSRSFMMYFGFRYNLHQMLIALICISSAGQTLCENTKEQTSLPCNLTNVCSNSNNSNNTNNTNNTEPPEKPWRFLTKEEMKKISVVTMSVSAMSGLLNFLVIVAIVIDPLKKLRKGPWVTILNLATADLISSVSFFCSWGGQFFTAIEQRNLYTAITEFGWIFGASGSFLWLTMFTVQIFVITKSPLKGRYWFTAKRMVLVGIVIWLCAFLLGLTNIVWLHFTSPAVIFKFYIGQIAVLQIAVFVQIILNIQVAVTIIRAGGSVGNVENNKHQNIAKTVIILTLILFLTAFPYFLFKQMEFLARMGYFSQSTTTRILNGLAYCYTPIATINFLANPILYSLRLPDYRKTLLVFIGKENRKTLMRSSSQFSPSRQTITSTVRGQRMSSTSM